MSSRTHAPDYLFIASIAILTIFGLIVLSSASSAVGFERFGDNYYYLKRQILFGLLPGIVIFLILSRVPRSWLQRYATLVFGAAILLLLLVFVPGLGASFGAANSWLSVGGFSLQPSELLKVALVLFLAVWLERRRSAEQTFLSGTVPFLLVMAIPAVPLALQPDIGTLAIILAIGLSMFFVAGAPLKHFVAIGVIGMVLFGLLIVSAPYRVARLTTFLRPESDPQGAGYQINQSLLAIGSGGLFGVGFGHSRQKLQYLPEVVSDSIFAIVGEELGFVATGGMVLLLMLIWIRIVRIARSAADTFGRLVTLGIGTWFVVQSFLNIGAMVGLLPITGVPLPFMSHGGTALLAALAGAGLVVNISRYTRPL